MILSRFRIYCNVPLKKIHQKISGNVLNITNTKILKRIYHNKPIEVTDPSLFRYETVLYNVKNAVECHIMPNRAPRIIRDLLFLERNCHLGNLKYDKINEINVMIRNELGYRYMIINKKDNFDSYDRFDGCDDFNIRVITSNVLNYYKKSISRVLC